LFVVTTPPMPTSPSSGASAPDAMLINVDLPAPFSPTSAWISPGRQLNVTPVSAGLPPNALETPVSRTAAAVSSAAIVALPCLAA
jgi:hypothetical protein